MKIKLAFILLSISFSASAASEDYLVRQLRAAPGNLPQLLQLITTTDYASMDMAQPITMRHAQGDQWDLMLISRNPADCDKQNCFNARQRFNEAIESLVHFDLSMIAESAIDWASFQEKAHSAGVFLIEMFHAAAGNHAALDQQRERENAYYMGSGREPNAIFHVKFGSDVDNFTIRFLRDMKEFAQGADLRPEQLEQVAKNAGFKDLADISFSLRETLIAHHDTLATKVHMEP